MTAQAARLKTIGGVQIADADAADMGVDVTLQSRCLTDTFQVVGGGGVSNSDVICGTNTDEHSKLAQKVYLSAFCGALYYE